MNILVSPEIYDGKLISTTGILKKVDGYWHLSIERDDSFLALYELINLNVIDEMELVPDYMYFISGVFYKDQMMIDVEYSGILPSP